MLRLMQKGTPQCGAGGAKAGPNGPGLKRPQNGPPCNVIPLKKFIRDKSITSLRPLAVCCNLQENPPARPVMQNLAHYAWSKMLVFHK